MVRPAVIKFSIWNRHKKAKAITAFLTQQGCDTILLVGTDGIGHGYGNEDIVEDAAAAGRTVKMGINIYPVQSPHPFVVADGCRMPFPDRFVDVSLSSAIIEHVGDEAAQRAFVAEQTRVARCWVITTPNRWFPVESHTWAVFLHWSAAYRARQVKFTRLLSKREFTAMLPEGAVVEGHWWSPTFTGYYAGASPSLP